MKSLTGKSSSTRGWALLLILFLGAGLLVAGCGEEEVPAPTTPAPAPPPPAPPPAPAPEPEPEKPATPTGLQVASKTANSITWTWNAVDGATGYVVQASTDETFDDTDQLVLTVQASYTATPLPPDTSVYLRVAAGVLTAAAPSLDPDDYLLSDWTTHVTGTTDAAASAALAAPANVGVTGRTATTITWSWNAVGGAAGYRVQHGARATIADDDPTAFASTTSHTVANLASQTNRYLRVQAYSGTISEPVFGGWSRTVEGTTDDPPAAPAPVTTELDPPGSVQAGSAQNNSIAVTWNAVVDAVEYAVRQRAGGSWDDANCNATGSNRVSSTSCVASGLDPATNYEFQVKAFPASAATTLTESPWSRTASDRTSGTPPPPPIMGGGDELNITWESKATSITWSWDAASDRRIQYQVALLADPRNDPDDADSTDARPKCPALASTPATGTFTGPDTGTGVWFAKEPTFAKTLGTSDSPLAEGQVWALCVVSTWDTDTGPQYGPVSLAWASTNPAEHTEDTATRVISGPKDSKSDTTAIDWYVTLDQGFDYEVGTVNVSVDDDASELSCSSVSGVKPLSGTGNTRHRLTTPADYTQYAACARARAKNGSGASGWKQLTTYWALPGKGPTPKYSTQGVLPTPDAPADATAAWTTAAIPGIVWSFSGGSSLPEDPGNYQIKIIGWANTARSATSRTTPTCDVEDVAANYAVVISQAQGISATGSGFENSVLDLSGLAAVGARASTTSSTGSYGSVYMWACVRAQLPAAPTGRAAGGRTAFFGPWSAVGSKTLSLGTRPRSE